MISIIDYWLRKISPGAHAWTKSKFRSFKKQTNPRLSKNQFQELLRNKLGIVSGDVVFVHSSMRNLYLDFDKSEILNLLLEAVGVEGTLLFPCWQFNTRAEDYIKEHDIVFDSRNTPSAMGKIPDVLRAMPGAYRSFHPTNSVVAIGAKAKELTETHADGIYPCGEQSPWFKMMKYKAKVIGIGVTVDNLTFVHTVEDTMPDQFPLKTRNPEVYNCKCIDSDGQVQVVRTLVASKAIVERNVFAFFKQFISKDSYTYLKIKKMDFFSLKTEQVFNQLKQLALKNKSIYHF